MNWGGKEKEIKTIDRGEKNREEYARRCDIIKIIQEKLNATPLLSIVHKSRMDREGEMEKSEVSVKRREI